MAIIRVAVPGPFLDSLDYLAGNLVNLQPGMRVRVSLRNKPIIGIVTSLAATSNFPRNKLKPVLEQLDIAPVVPPALMKLTLWISQYYHYPLGEVLMAAIPAHLRSGQDLAKYDKVAAETPASSLLAEVPPVLNDGQQQALNAVRAHFDQFNVSLLYGVTGSGKTEVYLRLIEEVIQRGQQALILVPEIGLTPQTLLRFQQRFTVPIAVLHSNLNDTERLQAWLMARSQVAPIIIGTRSAIFTPMRNPGMIIIDEEHDVSFKQQDSLRYSARDVAVMRGHMENIPVLLGSATPSLESYANAKTQKYDLLSLTERAGKAQLPKYQIIDLRNQNMQHGLSGTLIQLIKKHVAQDNQVLIFLNRRGYAPTLLCHQCGDVARCTRCDARLTLHQNPDQLRCHHCGHESKVHKNCQACGSDNLLNLGLGTQRLEQNLQKLFPDQTVIRVDKDNTRRKHAMKDLLARIQAGEGKILIGTQMLAKGHHFPRLTLVAIVDADSGLCSADFRAMERIAQTITQVAGRAGRAEQPGEVVIQTHVPDHPLLTQLIRRGYQAFADSALSERRAAALPPYGYMALVRAESLSEPEPLQFLHELCKLAQPLAKQIELLGPIPAPMAKRAGRYRAQLAFTSDKRQPLQQMLQRLLPLLENNKIARKVRWSIDVDPVDMS